jgi:hypothetical protein
MNQNDLPVVDDLDYGRFKHLRLEESIDNNLETAESLLKDAIYDLKAFPAACAASPEREVADRMLKGMRGVSQDTIRRIEAHLAELKQMLAELPE